MRYTVALLVSFCFTALLVGCQTELKVYDADGKRIQGLPVYTPAYIQVTKIISYEVDPKYPDSSKYCGPVRSDEIQLVPAADLYFVNYKGAHFAKTAFSIKLTGAGTVSEIGLGSDPEYSETVQAITGLAQAVLPNLLAESRSPGKMATSSDTPSKTSTTKAAEPTFEQKRKRYCIADSSTITDFKKIKPKESTEPV